MIADTDFLLSLLEADEGALRKLRELEAENVPIKIPAMAVLELYVGIGAELSEAEARRVDRIIDAHSVVGMDRTIATRAGRRIGTTEASRLMKNKGDAAIGATADAEGEAILTRNVDNFEALGFDVETY